MSITVRSVATAALLFTVGSAAQDTKSCEALKAEVATKIDANGVTVYTLEIVASDQVKPKQKVVGSCDAGRNRIVYTRGQQV